MSFQVSYWLLCFAFRQAVDIHCCTSSLPPCKCSWFLFLCMASNSISLYTYRYASYKLFLKQMLRYSNLFLLLWMGHPLFKSKSVVVSVIFMKYETLLILVWKNNKNASYRILHEIRNRTLCKLKMQWNLTMTSRSFISNIKAQVQLL